MGGPATCAGIVHLCRVLPCEVVRHNKTLGRLCGCGVTGVSRHEVSAHVWPSCSRAQDVPDCPATVWLGPPACQTYNIGHSKRSWYPAVSRSPPCLRNTTRQAQQDASERKADLCKIRQREAFTFVSPAKPSRQAYTGMTATVAAEKTFAGVTSAQ